MSFRKIPDAERNHPCFYSESKGRFGRIHLPVAPSCNIQCAYCRRDHDCPHENRPAVTSGVISPEEAIDRLEHILEEMPFISVAGIAGPGEAFSEPERTLDTFEGIRKKGLKIALCVSSNGLNLHDYVQLLQEMKVQFATVTINTIDPGIGTILVKKVKTAHGEITGQEASGWLIDKQIKAVSSLKAARLIVKVNTVVVPGVNDLHIPFLAKRMNGLGVDLMNLIPLIPIPGTDTAGLDPPSSSVMKKLREVAGRYVPQMKHCRRCRSDAAGLIDASRHQF